MTKVVNDYYKKRYLESKAKSDGYITTIQGVERTGRNKWRLGQR
ncbi:hypothetical protein [Clostridium botulinum]|nr:hypothetical protein [Clostridium botulinum]